MIQFSSFTSKGYTSISHTPNPNHEQIKDRLIIMLSNKRENDIVDIKQKGVQTRFIQDIPIDRNMIRGYFANWKF